MAEDQYGADLFKDIETGSTEADSSSKNREITTESSPTPNEPPTSVKGEKTTANKNPKSEGQDKDKGDSATPEESKKWESLLENILDNVFDFRHDLIKYVCEILAPKKWTVWVILQWIALFCFIGCLIASLTVQKMKNHLIWNFEMWKWCVLLTVAVCGRLISEWVQKNRLFVWWGLVLIAWLVLVIACVDNGGRRSKETREILDYITRVLGSLFIGAGLWLSKDLLLWSFAHSFQSKVFFDRILKAMFCKHVIESLLGCQSFGKRRNDLWWIDWADEINLVNEGKLSAVSIKLFIDVISDSSLLILPDISCEKEVEPASDKIFDILRRGKRSTRKRDAEAPHSQISVDSKIKDRDLTITKKDFLTFRIIEPEDVDMLFQLIGETLQLRKLIEGTSDSIKIKRRQLKHWLRTVYSECKSLECSLRNTRRGMVALDKLATGIVLILTCIMWLLMLKLLSGKAVALILSQLFVLTFVFGDTCKKIFEGIVFVFVTHPFDIGDLCVIEDGKEMVVKEINIQTTVFSRVDAVDDKDDKEKIVYPNSVLATKFVRNFRRHLYAKERSWEIKDLNILANGLDDGDKIKMGVYLTYKHIGSKNAKCKRKSEIVLFLKQILGGKTENVKFLVDASTSIKQIEALKARIIEDMKKNKWIKDISIRANDFEDGDKIKMGVYVTYKDFRKNNDERSDCKSKIVLGLKQILEDMGISEYHPKKNNVESAAAAFPSPTC
ncbi:hypothetical protein SLEP1_g58145 [Rubroshorea leprosula]|uniref:Mechanosensitive ion channel MscS domain-containing protein n=1 Tax=Rubroshorea leprosula TaxID=152421 RepID=A0AAV5MNT3_9ROSI|nr:hypothetical protein SLEP1_g58145 [Rubroshorea leprosula]